ncbi:transposase [Rhodobacterales bacterium]|nr:transposase [Rhodobacterales bacterium]
MSFKVTSPDAFKAKVALEALRGDKTIQEIAAKYQVHPNQVSTWKRLAVEGMADVFARGGKSEGPTEAEVKELHAKIGRLSVENDLYETVSVNRVAKHHRPQSASADTL